MQDTYRVLPHRDVRRLDSDRWEHLPCLSPLTDVDVIEANWCPHCAAVINKAAHARAMRDMADGFPHWRANRHED